MNTGRQAPRLGASFGTTLRAALTASVAATAAAAAQLSAQDVQRVSGDRVAIYNLAGRVEVVSGSGPDVVVRLTRGGADGDKLKIENGAIGGRNTLRVIYPESDIVYSDRGAGGGRGRFQTDVRVRPDGTFGDGGRGGERVTIRGSGSGLEAWADLRVEVPSGRAVEVHEAAGEAEVTSVDGRIRLTVGSGTVTASSVRGSLDLNTGSGSVQASDIEGELSIDTGSGQVHVERVRGPSVSIDTGSGGVEGSEINTPTVNIDTGSGSIRLTRVTSQRVSLDTGSGSVDVELMARVDDLVVDTGSGSVTLYLPADTGAEIMAETGSGGIDVDVPVQVRSVKRDHLEGRIGDGRGHISIETGSGAIRLVASK